MGFKENMANARENKTSFSSWPLGSYNVVLISAFRNESKGGNQQVNMDWMALEDAEGVAQGDKERQFHRLEGKKCEVSINMMIEQFGIMEVDLSECNEESELDEACALITNKHPMAVLTITQTVNKKGTFINRVIKEFHGDFAGDTSIFDEAPATGDTTQESSNVPSEPESVEIEVGSKFKYTYKDKPYSGEIKKLNHDNGTVDFAFHKGVSVDQLTEPA